MFLNLILVNLNGREQYHSPVNVSNLHQNKVLFIVEIACTLDGPSVQKRSGVTGDSDQGRETLLLVTEG